MKLKYYMLFLYGDLGETKEFASFVHSVFETLTDDNVKWVQDRHSAICHFSTSASLEEVTDFFSEIFDGSITAFFLLETPHRFGMRLSDRLTNHLFNLDIDSGYGQFEHDFNDEDFIDWNQKEIQNLGFKDDFEDFIEEEESPNDVRKIRQGYVEPLRMDNILDKISKKGIESLTVEEKKYLKNLSD